MVFRWSKTEYFDIGEWHDWFAWRPILISIGSVTYFVWLTTVQRIWGAGRDTFGSWNYRLK